MPSAKSFKISKSLLDSYRGSIAFSLWRKHWVAEMGTNSCCSNQWEAGSTMSAYFTVSVKV